jgi:hypothetical protein
MKKEAKILLLVLVTCFAVPETKAVIIFNDGGVHTINLSQEMQVFDTDYGRPTTVTITGGMGGIGTIYDSSITNMSGGDMQLLMYRDHSSGVISGGEMSALWVQGESQVYISGGSPASGHPAHRAIGTLTIYEHGQVYISGGSTHRINMYGNSYLDICGGQFWAPVPFSTASRGDIQLYRNASIVLHGSDFEISFPGFGPYTIPYGTYTGIGGPEEPYMGSIIPDFRITGTLDDGSAFDSRIALHNFASITLVPEPATLLLLGLGSLVLIRRRKRNSFSSPSSERGSFWLPLLLE